MGQRAHGSQPVSARPDLAETALESALRIPVRLLDNAHNPKVAGSNPAPAMRRKPAYQAGFRVFGRPQNRPKNALGQRLGQHEV
jgi:hypothetical protein